MVAVKTDNGTERLNRFIKATIEQKLKPEGMTSQLFWEIYNFLLGEEDSYSGTS